MAWKWALVVWTAVLMLGAKASAQEISCAPPPSDGNHIVIELGSSDLVAGTLIHRMASEVRTWIYKYKATEGKRLWIDFNPNGYKNAGGIAVAKNGRAPFWVRSNSSGRWAGDLEATMGSTEDIYCFQITGQGGNEVSFRVFDLGAEALPTLTTEDVAYSLHKSAIAAGRAFVYTTKSSGSGGGYGLGLAVSDPSNAIFRMSVVGYDMGLNRASAASSDWFPVGSDVVIAADAQELSRTILVYIVAGRGGMDGEVDPAVTDLSLTVKAVDLAGNVPSRMEIVRGSGQEANVNTPFDPLTVRVLDVFGAPAAGALVTFDAPQEGPGIVLSALEATTAANGTCGEMGVANDHAGSYEVVARIGETGIRQSFYLTNTQRGGPDAGVTESSDASLGRRDAFICEWDGSMGGQDASSGGVDAAGREADVSSGCDCSTGTGGVAPSVLLGLGLLALRRRKRVAP